MRTARASCAAPLVCGLSIPQGHSHETTELKLLFLNEGYAVLARGISAGFPLLCSDHGETGAANRGRLLFDYFFWAMQEKVISRRAAPGKNPAPTPD
ncbi:MAG: hypothetical protein WC208_15680 [Gallionella sp.]|jgi:hypothetical protein